MSRCVSNGRNGKCVQRRSSVAFCCLFVQIDFDIHILESVAQNLHQCRWRDAAAAEPIHRKVSNIMTTSCLDTFPSSSVQLFFAGAWPHGHKIFGRSALNSSVPALFHHDPCCFANVFARTASLKFATTWHVYWAREVHTARSLLSQPISRKKMVPIQAFVTEGQHTARDMCRHWSFCPSLVNHSPHWDSSAWHTPQHKKYMTTSSVLLMAPKAVQQHKISVCKMAFWCSSVSGSITSTEQNKLKRKDTCCSALLIVSVQIDFYFVTIHSVGYKNWTTPCTRVKLLSQTDSCNLCDSNQSSNSARDLATQPNQWQICSQNWMLHLIPCLLGFLQYLSTR